MAKLEKEPFVLKALDIINIIVLVVAVLSTAYGVMSIINDGENTAQSIMLAISSIVGWAVTSSLYYIVKAACIYIEKEEKE